MLIEKNVTGDYAVLQKGFRPVTRRKEFREHPVTGGLVSPLELLRI